MFYWLFKRYMKRLIREFKVAYEAEAKMSQNTFMRPDFYWLERFLNDELEWEQTDNGSIIRRVKK